MQVWRTRAWPGPGSPTSTVCSVSTSGPPVRSNRMALDMMFLVVIGEEARRWRARSGLRHAQAGRRQFGDVALGLRPGAVAGCRIEVPDFAEIVEAAAPGARQFGDTLDPRERIVAA